MRIIAALLICLSMTPVLSVESAEIFQETDVVMGCQFRIEGEIRSGDAERIRSFVQSFNYDIFSADPDSRMANDAGYYHFKRVCLNSPGGSLTEAIKIAKVLYKKWGTAIASNHTCESACSIIFMAGSGHKEDHRGVLANRVLHPLGRLGFHAPKLTIEDGNYSAGTVSKAYYIALQGIWQIFDISGFIKFPPSLISEMIATPSDKMMYIDTIGKAARWQIMIAPVVKIRELTNLAIINACNNHYLYLSEIISLNGFYTRDHKIKYDISELKIEKKEYRKIALLGGFGQESASVCRLEFTNTWQAHQQIPTKTVGSVSIGEGVGIEINSGQFFGPSTPISSLARQNDQKLEEVEVYDRSKDIRISTGRCFVFSAETLVDNEPCTQFIEIHFNDIPKEISSFVWPSGSKTILELNMLKFELDEPEGKLYKINGVSTDVDRFSSWNKDQKPPGAFNKNAERENIADWSASCWLNSSTLNRFCFQEYYPLPIKFQ